MRINLENLTNSYNYVDKPASHGFYVFNSSSSPNGNIFYPDEAKVVTKSIFIDDEEGENAILC